MIYQNRNSNFVDSILPDTTKREVTENLVFLSVIELPDHVSRFNSIPLVCHTLYQKKNKKIVKFMVSVPEIDFETEYEAIDDSAVAKFDLPVGIEKATLIVQAIDEIGNTSNVYKKEYLKPEIPYSRKPTVYVDDNVSIDFIAIDTSVYSVYWKYEDDEQYQWDKHVASQYRIRDVETDAIAFDSGQVTNALTRYVINYIPDTLVPDREYIIEARHCGEILEWSDWSDPVVRFIAGENNSWYPYSREYTVSTAAEDAVFVVPEDTEFIRALVIGGGSLGKSTSTITGGAGGKGGGITSAILRVTPGEQIPITVGALAYTGGNSSVSNYVTSTGGSTVRGRSNFVRHQNVGRIITEVNTSIPANKFCRTAKELSLNNWVTSWLPEDYVLPEGQQDPTVLVGSTGQAGAYKGGVGSNGTQGETGTTGRTGTTGKDGGYGSSPYPGGPGGTGGYGGPGTSGGAGANGLFVDSEDKQVFISSGGNGGAGGAGGTGGTGGTGGKGGGGQNANSGNGGGGDGGQGGTGGTGGAGGRGGNGFNGGDGGNGGAGGAAGSGGSGGEGGAAGHSRGMKGSKGKAGSSGTAGKGGAGGNSSAGLVIIYYYSEKQHQQELEVETESAVESE